MSYLPRHSTLFRCWHDRNHCEGLELLLHKQQANYEVDKGTLEGVITILQGQLQQKHSEGLSFENLLQRLQDIEANGRNANTNNNGNKVNTKSPTTSYNNRKHSQTDKTMKEQEATIKSQTTKLRELLDSQYAENPISSISGLVTDLLTHVLEHTKILGEELQKEREKNALLIERLDQELENEDTLLLTMDNLEKQISQISCNSRSYSFNFLSASEAKDKEIDRDGQNKDNERAWSWNEPRITCVYGTPPWKLLKIFIAPGSEPDKNHSQLPNALVCPQLSPLKVFAIKTLQQNGTL